MADMTLYENAVRSLLQRYAALKPHNEDLERQVWTDSQHGHFQLLNIGWHDDKRVRHCVMHFDIKNDKIWIQHNSTEVELDEELIALGVAPDDIVLGFLPAYRRPGEWQKAA